MTAERYIGFYTSMPFWAGEKLDLSDKEKIKATFTDLMSEEVFKYETDEHVLKICKDGMFLFQIKEIAHKLQDEVSQATSPNIEHTIKQWSTYLECLNCIYLLFESSFLKELRTERFKIAEITNQDAFSVAFENGKHSASSISFLSFVSQFQLGRYLSNYRESIPLTIDHRISFRLEVPKIVFDRLHKDFSKAYSDHNTVKMLAETVKSMGEYKIANYSTSLVLSWFIIESYLDSYWKKLLDSKNTTYGNHTKRISRDRREYLTGRDYPISIIANLLELFDVLDFQTFCKIDKVRKTRNKIVHDSAACEAQDCQTAFDIIKEFIRKDTGIDLEFNLSYSIRGL